MLIAEAKWSVCAFVSADEARIFFRWCDDRGLDVLAAQRIVAEGAEGLR